MDSDSNLDLIEVVPILGSDIGKYREEVHDRIILNALFYLKSKKFQIRELNDKITEIFGIEYPKERLIYHLEKIFGDSLEYQDGRILISAGIPKIDNEINDLIEFCFKEFIISMKGDYNPALHQRYRDTFYELIYETSKNILSSTNIIKLDMDIIDFRKNRERMIEIIACHNIQSFSSFLNLFYEYLSSDSKSKDKIILSIFQYAISIDLLERGSELYAASREFEEKGILIIDTNIITSLISHEKHSKIKNGGGYPPYPSIFFTSYPALAIISIMVCRLIGSVLAEDQSTLDCLDFVTPSS